jgi:hypothetical protein
MQRSSAQRCKISQVHQVLEVAHRCSRGTPSTKERQLQSQEYMMQMSGLTIETEEWLYLNRLAVEPRSPRPTDKDNWRNWRNPSE